VGAELGGLRRCPGQEADWNAVPRQNYAQGGAPGGGADYGHPFFQRLIAP
jgi:hypothetical protein